MAEDNTATAVKNEEALDIPEETVKEFPELVEMIKKSHSMDTEERQYWIDVLPIMSEDQVANLRDILDNEKRQIEEANRVYDEGMRTAVKKVKREFDVESYKEKKRALLEAERLHEQEEKEREEATLQELDNL